MINQLNSLPKAITKTDAELTISVAIDK